MRIRSTSTIPSEPEEMRKWLQLFHDDFVEMFNTVTSMPRMREVALSGTSGSTTTLSGLGVLSTDPNVRLTTEQSRGGRIRVKFEFEGGGSRRFTVLVFGG